MITGDINKLVDLQEIDSQVVEIQGQLNQYPRIWDEVKIELRKLTEEAEAATKAHADRAAERKRIEQDLRISSDKLVNYQAQQMMVKSSKELTAINNQIDSLKKTIARLEEQGLAILNSEDEVTARIESTAKAVAEAKAKAKVERERIRKQVDSKTRQLETLRADRDKIAGKVSPDSLETYERVRRRWPVNPVVAVRNRSCTGCQWQILPQKMVELHQAEHLALCDNCGRILSEDQTPAEEQ